MKKSQKETVPWKGFRDPRIILKHVLENTGNNPEPEKYFKRTPSGLLIHSSKNSMQYFLGILCIILLIPSLDGLYAALVGKTIEKGLPEKNAFLIWLALGVIAVIMSGFAIYCLTVIRETWWNSATDEMIVRTRKFFHTRKKRYRRSMVKAVQLRGEIRKGRMTDLTFWSVKIEMANSEFVPITIPFFSESAVIKGAGDNSYEKSLDKLPIMAWTLSRLLDVPLDFAYKDLTIRADSVDQFISAINESKYKKEEKRLYKLELTLRFCILCSLIVCAFLMGAYRLIEKSFSNAMWIPVFICILAITSVLIGLSVSLYYKSKPH